MSVKYNQRANCYFTERQLENLKAIGEQEGTKLSVTIRNLVIKGMKEYYKK